MSKTCPEILAETLEQVDMPGLFSGEAQESTDATVVPVKSRPGVFQNEGKYKLLDQTEGVKVTMATNLVKSEFFFGAQEGQPFGPCERFRKERPGEIKLLVAPDEVLDLPVDLPGG
jgi:hypothetical protein